MDTKTLEKLKEKALHLPEKAGVYIMKSSADEIIYIGKAKSLKNRVNNYFTAIDKHNDKTYSLVGNINDFEIIIVKSEFEAFLLEASLIKKHQPKYNIKLKDDKGYPFIKVNFNDKIPRFTVEAKRKNDKADYFGPYKSRTEAHNIIYAISRAFGLADCHGNFKKSHGDNVTVSGRACINMHIGRCIGICVGKVTLDEYRELVKNAVKVLEGKTESVYAQLLKMMESASDAMLFERAAYYRDVLKSLDKLKEKQQIIIKQSLSCDTVWVEYKSEAMCITVVSVKNGVFTGALSNIIEIADGEEQTTVLTEYLCRFYEIASVPQMIYCRHDMSDMELLEEYLTFLRTEKSSSVKKVKINTVIRGEYLKLLELARLNCEEYYLEYKGKTDKQSRCLNSFCDCARLSKTPERIEIYDVSHTSGSNTVCGMAVFEDNKFNKSAYRLFNIEDANKDDCRAMAQAASRRLKRALSGDEAFMSLPSLIIADGGREQVSAVINEINAAGIKDITVIGLKKDNRHKTKSVVLSDGSEIILKNNPEAMVFAARLQDEVHRFAIKSHSNRQTKAMKDMQLTNIPGIGKKRANALLAYFKSVKSIREASIEELIKVEGISKETAKEIFKYLSAI